MTRGRIAAVVLAAGASTRLGRPKQIEGYRGKSLLARAVDAAKGGGCEPVVVVLGAHLERVRPEVADREVEVVVNRNWEQGMSTSIRAGVEAVSSGSDALAVVLLACDQPRVSEEIVARLCAAFDGQPRRRVASEYAGSVGVPALFERSLFDDLLNLQGDVGARSVLLSEPGQLVRLPFPEGAIDIDTDG